MATIETSYALKIDGCAVCFRALPPTPDAADDPGLPVVLLHGLGCSGAAWEPVLEILAERGCGQFVVAPDLPGYGESECAGATMSIDALADWTAEFLDRRGLGRVHVAGHSMGCQVALALARRRPARVGGVVLVGPTTGRRAVSLWRYSAGLILDGFCEPLRYNVALARMYAEMGMPRYFAALRHMMHDDPLGQATQVSAPCLILRGTRDRVIPLRGARLLASSLPQGEFSSFPHGAHAAQYQAPDVFIANAMPFWRKAAGLESAVSLSDAPDEADGA